jgi:hypothetical protein
MQVDKTNVELLWNNGPRFMASLDLSLSPLSYLCLSMTIFFHMLLIYRLCCITITMFEREREREIKCNHDLSQLLAIRKAFYTSLFASYYIFNYC